MPQLGPHIPMCTEVALSSSPDWRGSQGSVDLARGLVAAGILEESDWAGSVHATVKRGLLRWANEVKGMGSVRMFDMLNLGVCDDIMACGFDVRREPWCEAWGRRFGDIGQPLGALILDCKRPGCMRECWCRDAVLALESYCEGAGYGVMNVLAWALEFTVTSQSFAWAYKTVRNNNGHPTNDGTELSLARLQEVVPEEADLVRFDPGVATAALDSIEAYGGKGSGRLRRVLYCALELDQLVRRVEREWSFLSHARAMPIEVTQVQHPTVLFRWSENDEMRRISDCFYHEAMQNNDLVGRCYIHAFQMGHPGIVMEDQFANRRARMSWMNPVSDRVPDGGFDAAIKALDLTLDIVRLSDEILFAIADPAKSGMIDGRNTGQKGMVTNPWTSTLIAAI